MKIVAKKDRKLLLINIGNTQNENKAETIELTVPEEYEDYNKKIVFVTDDGIVWDIIQDNTYKLTKAITKYKQVDFYIWLTKDDVDFRSKTMPLSFYHNVDASDEITPEEISGVNTVVNLLEEEIEKVENLNIEATKIGSTTTVTITKKDGTTESVEINDGTDGQDGRDGQDGYTPQKGIDYFTEQDIEEIEGDILNEVYTKSETDTLLQEKADIEDIPDVSSFITKDVNNLTNYTLKTNTGSLIDLEINDTTYVVTLKLKTIDGTVISTDTIDLPLESVVVSGRYDNTTKKVILTLENGSEVDFSVADLVAGLQTEITSQNKLASDLVDDTNSGNKFVTTTEKQTWNNKLDESDLTDYVKNTDYATSSKGGTIKTENGLGTYVNANGTINASTRTYQQYVSSTNETFIGKGTLENVIAGKQLINQTQLEESQEIQDEEIEKLQTENARLKATLPTTTGEGQDVTLNKTAELEFKKPPLPMGNSEQESTEGTNLIGLDTEQYRVDLSEGDKLTITNNTSEQIVMDLYSNYGDTQRNDWFSFVANDTRTITLLHDTKAIAWRNAINGIAWCNSGETALPYEKYTGGTASPNPDYPQEITNVTGDVEVVVKNKNFLPQFEESQSQVTSNGVTITKNSDGTYTLNGTSTGVVDYVLFGSWSSKNVKLKIKTGNIYVKSNNLKVNGYVGFVDTTGSASKTITIAFNNHYNNSTVTNVSYSFIRFCSSAGIVFNNEKVIVQASYENTDVVIHKEQKFIFPLGNEKLMLGDYLADDGIHHVRGQYNLNGDEDIVKYINSTYAFALYIPNNIPDIKHNSNIDNIFCNKLLHSTLNNLYYKIETTGNNLISSQGSRTFAIMINNYTDINELKGYLKEQYNNGTPIIVEYELQEEIIVPYTSAQQEVYNQIKQALSYEEQTNISSNTIALFNVEAYQDAKVILAEKGTYSKPSTGIPKADLASAVQTSLGKADTALQSHQDISGKANKISVVQTSTSAIEINSNTFYKFGEVASLNITLASITDNTIYNEYMFEFVSGTTATTLTLPSSIKWLETPTIDANKIYQCSIVDNVGLLVGVTNV